MAETHVGYPLTELRIRYEGLRGELAEAKELSAKRDEACRELAAGKNRERVRANRCERALRAAEAVLLEIQENASTISDPHFRHWANATVLSYFSGKEAVAEPNPRRAPLAWRLLARVPTPSALRVRLARFENRRGWAA